MSYQLILQDGLGLLTLQMPEKSNLLTPELSMHIADDLQALFSDPQLKVFAVQGSGRSFCAGADLHALQQASQGDGAVLKALYRAFRAVAECPVLSVALVNGAATGAGMNLAMACDIRCASPEAWFESRFFQLAIHPGGGHTALLPQQLGWQQAAAMLLAGERLSATEALRLGFVKELLPYDELETYARTIARRVTEVPAELLRQTKQSMRELAGTTQLADAVELEYQRQFASIQTPLARQRISELLARIQQKEQA